MFNRKSFFVYLVLVATIDAVHRSAFVIDERYVCSVKQSCVECLKFPQCSWCINENKCFSKSLETEFCTNNTIIHENLGFSLQENAECSCSSVVEQRCQPLGTNEGPVCSGRGECVCGRCVCSVPDPQEPSKMVMGEFCEFDNFSCDDPKCNEGPYLLNSLYEHYSRNIDSDIPPTP